MATQNVTLRANDDGTITLTVNVAAGKIGASSSGKTWIHANIQRPEPIIVDGVEYHVTGLSVYRKPTATAGDTEADCERNAFEAHKARELAKLQGPKDKATKRDVKAEALAAAKAEVAKAQNAPNIPAAARK